MIFTGAQRACKVKIDKIDKVL